MTIHLSAEGFTAPGMDTFWDWALRSFPGARARMGEYAPVGEPAQVGDHDVVLYYAALGAPVESQDRTTALCWELYPEMARYLPPDTRKIEMMRDAARACRWRTVSTSLAVPDFDFAGEVEVLPIGVDTDLFAPRIFEKQRLRDKWGIPIRARVGFWSGTLHPMKGFRGVVDYVRDHPDVFWVILWKWPPTPPVEVTPISGTWERRPALPIANAVEYSHLPQSDVAELMACCDFVLCSGLLRPFYLVEWEAMACDLAPVVTGNPAKDFVPSGYPRDDVFNQGWDRFSALELWLEYLEQRGNE